MIQKKSRILLGLIALMAVLSIVAQYLENGLYIVLKPVTTLLIILLVVWQADFSQPFSKGILAGLIFCLLGDILLLEDQFFVFGLSAFLCAHLLFSRAFVRLNGWNRDWRTGIVLLFVGIGIYIWLFPGMGKLQIPVAVYILVILFMAWQGLGIYQKRRLIPNKWIAVGVLLFMFSDTLIAIEKFKTQFAASGLLILATYWLAITLIALAAVTGSGKEIKMQP